MADTTTKPNTSTAAKAAPVPAAKAAPVVDYIKLFNDKSNQHIQTYQGQPNHNPFLFLRAYEDIRVSIMNNTPFTPEQIARIKCEWSAPKV